MVRLSILKHLEDLSDEVLIHRWVQNPYYQAFTGGIEFLWHLPCDPSDLTCFNACDAGVAALPSKKAVKMMLAHVKA